MKTKQFLVGMLMVSMLALGACSKTDTTPVPATTTEQAVPAATDTVAAPTGLTTDAAPAEQSVPASDVPATDAAK